MNIALITNSIGYGGVEKIVNFVASYLSERENSVTILNLDAVPDYVNKHEQTFDDRVKVVTFKKSAHKKHFSRIRHIISAIRENHIDVMVAFTMFPNFYAKIASLFTGVPSIMSERGDPNATFTRSLKDRVIYWVVNSSKGAVFQTKEASMFYAKSLCKRGVVIPNPIFLKGAEVPIVSMQNRRKTVVSVGRFQNVQKRYDIMLEAFQKFSQIHPDYLLKLYGSGEDEALICKWIEELGITNKVKIMGAIKEPMKHIYDEGMFLITSDYEGIPNALLEAMAVGLPVVATDCSPGGARLLIRNGENGQIVPVRDSNAIAKALSRYADDKIFAAQCGNNARQVLQTFSPVVIGELWESYIKKIVNKR